MTGLSTPTQRKGLAARSSAFTVSAGILLSRLLGLVRDRVFAHYFGNSNAADAFRGAFRIPNFLQTLFGEGVLSASFIPVYARLRAEERHEEASQLAEAIFAILFLIGSLITLAGVFAAPWLIDAIVPGFSGETRLLTIRLVQILFPGAALLVLSAWCLGILNSHRKFFLSYTAPVIWNVAMIAALLWKGGHVGESRLAIIISIASVIGSGLQFAVQLPTVLRLLQPLNLHFTFGTEHVRTVVRNFFPVFLSRGVVQISAYVDSFLASFITPGAVSALAYAQTLNTLPVKLVRYGDFCRRAARYVERLGNAGGDRGRTAAAVGTGAAKYRFLRSSFSGGFSGSWRRGRGHRIQRGELRGPRCDLRMECAGGIGRWAAGFDIREAVFLCVLCVAGYTHTVELRHYSRGVDRGHGLSVCPAAS